MNLAQSSRKMILWLLPWTVLISTDNPNNAGNWWMVGGPLDQISTGTLPMCSDICNTPILSTMPVSGIPLKSPEGNCYSLKVNANGGLFTNWIPCQ